MTHMCWWWGEDAWTTGLANNRSPLLLLETRPAGVYVREKRERWWWLLGLCGQPFRAAAGGTQGEREKSGKEGRRKRECRRRKR